MSDIDRVKPVKVLVDVTVNVDPPKLYYGCNLEERFRYLEKWADEFSAFVRDHRSQDPVHLNVARVYMTQCSGCGKDWETMDDGHGRYCAWCGTLVAP